MHEGIVSSPVDEPVAYWRLGAPVDDVILVETSGANNLRLAGTGHATVAGAIANDPDKAMHFDGKSSRLLAANPRVLDFVGMSFTVECWAKWSGGNQLYQHLINNSVGVGGARRGYLLFLIPSERKIGWEWLSDDQVGGSQKTST